ncbi:MAG: asparagine synthase-related protein [archaeon]
MLLKSVEKRYNSNSFVVPISGGYDSRGILGCLREMTDKPIKTVSWGVNESDINSEAYIGRKIARFMNTEHFLEKNL